MSNTSSRRSFLYAPAAAAGAVSYGRILGANDRIRLGVIGTGGRGQYLMKEAARAGEIEWVAVCDVYSARRDKAASIAGGAVKTYNDHRQLLDISDIDAVIVATPDHWHAPVAVDAMKAGKDVYVEKPMVHYPKDGQAIVKAARQYKRIVQVGMQARAIPHFQEARQRYVDSGVMGKIGLVRTWYDANSGYVLVAPPGMEQKPDGLDWDRWCGPGPKVPWNPNIYFSPYKWLHYDGGMVMGIGIHVVDSAHQFLKLKNPKAAVAGGGIYHYKDGRDTPDVVNLVLEYPQEVNVTFEAEIMTAGMPSSTAGLVFKGTGGELTVLRYDRKLGYQYVPNPKNSTTPPAQAPGDPASAEWLLRNWLDCIRTRQKTVANEEEGYWSAMACFMGNQALRTRSRVVWDEKWNLPA
jgi:predicted dehydrogenase